MTHDSNTPTLDPIALIDTSYLLVSPHALERYTEAQIVIPLSVLETLEEHATLHTPLRLKSKQALETLDGLRRQGRVVLQRGTEFRELWSGSPRSARDDEREYDDTREKEPRTSTRDNRKTLRPIVILATHSLTDQYTENRETPVSAAMQNGDATTRQNDTHSKIPQALCSDPVLSLASELQTLGAHVTLYTRDMHQRAQAFAAGIARVESSLFPERQRWTLSTPVFTLPSKELKALTASRIYEHLKNTEKEHFSRLHSPNSSDQPRIARNDESVERSTPLSAGDLPLYRNQYCIFTSENNRENKRMFRYLGGTAFKEVHEPTLLGVVKALNEGQLLALDALLDDSIKLVSLIGLAGSGKTFLTLLAGIIKVVQDRTYRKIVVTRPTVAVGPDIGFLPGDVGEKLDSWMYPVRDNVEAICHLLTKKSIPFRIDFATLLKNEQLSLQALTYMRGRSLPHQFLYVDEAQNMTPLEVKTLITRAGAGTKVILAGDPDQIDTPHLTKETNGLTVTTERFLGDRLFAAIQLETSERSELAQRAAELL